MEKYSKKLKRALALVLSFVMVVSVLTVAPSTEVSAAPSKYVKSLKVSKSKLTLTSGKKATVKATVSVKGSASKNVKVSMSSSTKKVVSVKVGKPSKKGVSNLTITAKNVTKKKTVKVKVVTSGKNSKKKTVSKTIKVTVNPKETPATTQQPTTQRPTTEAPTTEAPTTEAPTTEAPTTEAPKPIVKVTDVTVKLKDSSIVIGGKTKASVVVEPETATNKTVKYSIESGAAYATINEITGEITAIGAGTVVVKATAQDGSNVSGTATLKIEGQAGITLQQHTLSLAVGNQETLAIANKTPASDIVDFVSSDETVATVDNNGLVKAIKSGIATITATTTSGATDTCKVTVVDDDTVIVTAFNVPGTDGIFTVKVKMQNDANEVSEALLRGTTLIMTHKESGAKITATYVKNTLEEDGTATYSFDRTKLKNGTYTLSAGSGDIAINSGTASDLVQTVTISELTTGIKGHVYDDYGLPVANATVSLKSQQAVIRTTKTDVNGFYEFEQEENDGLTIDASASGYFNVSYPDIVVTNNKITTCNIALESIVERDFAIIGKVAISDDSDTQKINTNGYPTVTLQVESDGSFIDVATTKVNDEGRFAFCNSGISVMFNSKYAKKDTKGNVESYYYNYNNTGVITNSAMSLSKSKSYRVVVSKELSSRNLTAVYKEAVKEVTLSDTSKVTSVNKGNDIVLEAVAKFAGIKVASGAIKWKDDAVYEPASEDVEGETVEKESISAKLYTEDGIYFYTCKWVDDEEQTRTKFAFKVKDKVSSEEIVLVASEKINLPAGSYFVKISNNTNADSYNKFTVNDKGDLVTFDNVEFGQSKQYTFTVRINNEDSVKKEELSLGDTVKIKDLIGTTSTSSVAMNLKLYLVDASGEEVAIDETNLESFKVVEKNDDDATIEASWPISGLVKNQKYRIYYTCPVLNVDPEVAANANDITELYYEFTYTPEKVKNTNIPSFVTKADLETVKLVSATQLPEMDTTKPVYVSKIELLDKAQTVISGTVKDVNKYYSCGNYNDMDEGYQQLVNSVYGAGDLIDDGIVAGYSNLPAGTYFIRITIDGYQPLLVPTDGLKLEGLYQGVYAIPEGLKFEKIPAITISGNIVDVDGNAITERVDVTVKNKAGVVVAMGTSVYDDVKKETTISIVNDVEGNVTGNALLEQEAYTLIFRSASYAVKTIKTDVLKKGVNSFKSVTLDKGVGTVKATVYEDGTTQKLLGASAYAKDSEFVEYSEDKFANALVLQNYMSLAYNGKHAMTFSGDGSYVSTPDKVSLATYTVVVEGEYYETTEKSAGTLNVANGFADAGVINVPRKKDSETTQVVFDIMKSSAYNNNANGYDLIKVYTADGEFVDCYCDDVHNGDSTTRYSTPACNLKKGNYKVYLYSKNYYVAEVEFTVSAVSTSEQKVLVAAESVPQQ